MKDLGGNYFTRRHKDTLEEFNVDNWRETEREIVRQSQESRWEVFERWGKLGEEEERDWEAVVSGIGLWEKEKVYPVSFTWLRAGCEERKG